jgi:hypothetical protein
LYCPLPHGSLYDQIFPKSFSPRHICSKYYWQPLNRNYLWPIAAVYLVYTRVEAFIGHRLLRRLYHFFGLCVGECSTASAIQLQHICTIQYLKLCIRIRLRFYWYIANPHRHLMLVYTPNSAVLNAQRIKHYQLCGCVIFSAPYFSSIAVLCAGIALLAGCN